MKKIWAYGTSTPIQRVGVIILAIGFVSLLSWIYKADLDFEDIFDSYYFPKSRDSFFFHLYFYFIPIGLLMSWGYRILLKVKQWVIGKPPEKSNDQLKSKLIFKDNLAAFEFANTLYPAKLDLNKTYIGIVKDIVLTLDERFQYTIEIANTDTVIKVYGYNEKYPQELKIYSLVLWSCEKPISGNNFHNIEALGSILATVKPEFCTDSKQWVLLNDLTK